MDITVNILSKYSDIHPTTEENKIIFINGSKLKLITVGKDIIKEATIKHRISDV